MSDTPETDEIFELLKNKVGMLWEVKPMVDKLERERNELRSTLEYIATADLSARHCEDEARKALAKLNEKQLKK